MMRNAVFVIRINKRKNIISWDIDSVLLTPDLIINEKDFPCQILKNNWLGANETENKNVIQEAGLAFKE
jgi:hypothetical protein